jgi:hypothetical protein
MKKIIFLLASLYCTQIGFSQTSDLDKYNHERERMNKRQIKVLGIYAAGSMLYSGIATSKSTGSNKYFHQMNVIWNGINATIVGLSLLAPREKTLSYSNSLRKQSGAEKIFLFNAGLDLAYIAGGAYVRERSFNNLKNSTQNKGYGESIMLQGGVLLIMDAVMFVLHNKHGKILNKMGEKVTLAATGNGLGLVVKL